MLQACARTSADLRQQIMLDDDPAVPLALAAASHNAAEMLRVSPADEHAVASAERHLRAGAALLARLADYAAAAGSSPGAVWQALLAAGPGGSTAGTAKMARTPPRCMAPDQRRAPSFEAWQGSDFQLRCAIAALEGNEEAVLDRAAAAEALRSLLRLSLCDDADLALASHVVSECSDFFRELHAHAAAAHSAPGAAWAKMMTYPIS